MAIAIYFYIKFNSTEAFYSTGDPQLWKERVFETQKRSGVYLGIQTLSIFSDWNDFLYQFI